LCDLQDLRDLCDFFDLQDRQLKRPIAGMTSWNTVPPRPHGRPGQGFRAAAPGPQPNVTACDQAVAA